MEVALDRYTHTRCWLLYRWNHGQKVEEKGHNAVYAQMEVEFYRAQLQNHHLVVVQLVSILSFLCWCDGGE